MPSAFETWSRKLHIYLGLLSLFFLWLFSLSGIILNHPKWQFAGFWENRSQKSYELRVSRPQAQEVMLVAKAVMVQLDIHGEIAGRIVQPSSGEIDFQVTRPGHIFGIKADFNNGIAKVSHIQVNGWGVLNMLHHFTGVTRSDPEVKQNWWATGVWRFSMDATSVSLAIMVLSGIYLRYRRTQRQIGLSVALALGIVVISCFLAF